MSPSSPASFACNRLLEWYRQGRDVNALLPALATYMGHTCISYTQTYLHATPELMQVANERFCQNYLYPSGSRRCCPCLRPRCRISLKPSPEAPAALTIAGCPW